MSQQVSNKGNHSLPSCLFILFINDVCYPLDIEKLTDKDIELLSMYMLLFADDIVLFTTDHVSLQAQICMNIQLSGV